MSEKRPFPWLAAFLLALPLAGLVWWLAAGGISASFGPDLSASPAAEKTASSPASILPGFPPPEGDYGAERMWERVNGAADALRAEGCGRILVWRIDDPPAELELLVFDGEEGAARVLARDTGPERTAGPGDEASVGEEAIFFRRGRFYARLFAEPSPAARSGALLDLAARVDAGLETMTGETS
jgi:hypothetical protein